MKFRWVKSTVIESFKKCLIHKLKTRAYNNSDKLSMFIFVRFTNVSEMKVGMSFIQMNWAKCPEKVHMLTHSHFIQLI